MKRTDRRPQRARAASWRRGREGFAACEPQSDSRGPTYLPKRFSFPVFFPIKLANILKFANNQLCVYLCISQEDS